MTDVDMIDPDTIFPIPRAIEISNLITVKTKSGIVKVEVCQSLDKNFDGFIE